MRHLHKSIAILLALPLATSAAAAAQAPDAGLPMGDPLAIVGSLHAWQAQTLGEAWIEAKPVAGHASPSEAIAEIAARHGAKLDAEQQAAAVGFDTLDAPLRAALVRTLDAYLDYDAATRAAFEGADLSGIANDDGSLRPVHEVDVDALGLKLAPTLAARLNLLDASVTLADVLGDSPAVFVPPVIVAGVIAINLGVGPQTYTDDYAFQLDGGGADVYLNNAGGSGVEHPGTCSTLNTRPAAALLDLGVSGDSYGASNRECGRNGGAVLGSGFLYDEAGNDVYRGREWGVNGATSYGLGFLFDAAGHDSYLAANSTTNGGGAIGAGLLVDLGGNDIYSATEHGTNGGGVLGTGTLYDAGGNDRYTATSGGVNGGGNLGFGLLLDGDGTDVYSDQAGGSGTDRTVVPKELVGAQIDEQSGASFATPPFPSGAPTAGPDADGDGVPAFLSFPQSSFVVDSNGASLRAAAPLVVPVDPDDGDANDPGRVGTPSASLDWGCQTDTVCLRASAPAGAAGSDLSVSEDMPIDLGGVADLVADASGHRPYTISGDQLILHGLGADVEASTPAAHADGPQHFFLHEGTVDFGCSSPGSVTTPTLTTGGIVETGLPGQSRDEPAGVANLRCMAMAPLTGDTAVELVDAGV